VGGPQYVNEWQPVLCTWAQWNPNPSEGRKLISIRRFCHSSDFSNIQSNTSVHTAVQNLLVSIMEMHFHVHNENLWHFEKKTSLWRSQLIRYELRYLPSLDLILRTKAGPLTRPSDLPVTTQCTRSGHTHSNNKYWKSLSQVRLFAHKHHFKRPDFCRIS
jgi:hypothetical protein